MSFYIQAHQDDWQGHMSSHACEDLPTDGPVVFIFTTNGDGGYVDGMKALPDSVSYSAARNEGARSSVEFIVNTDAGRQAKWVRNLNYTINGHKLEKWSIGNKVCIFMQLDDGQLRAMKDGSRIRTTSGEAYNWEDFRTTLANIIVNESLINQENNSFWIHAIQSGEFAGHDDHATTGDAVKEAMQHIKNAQLLPNRIVNIRWFRGSYDADCRSGSFTFPKGKIETKGSLTARITAFYAYEFTMLRHYPHGDRCTLRERPVQIAKWISDNVILGDETVKL